MFGRLVRAALTASLVVLLASIGSFLCLCWQINDTGSQDLAQAADAIIVLGARVTTNGEPGPDLRSRTLHGVRLYQQGLAPTFICTGGYQDDRLSAASVACNLAVYLGVPAEQVLLADGSMTTGEDALSAGRLAKKHRLQTALLVSHPLHLERASILFEGQGLTVFPSPTSTDLSAIPWPTRAWLTAREAVGILWIGLEGTGVPDEWTVALSRWVYGLPIDAAPPSGGKN
jgi:uncharacterized SAM-binding protein YcdF (DUF218 family)